MWIQIQCAHLDSKEDSLIVISSITQFYIAHCKSLGKFGCWPKRITKFPKNLDLKNREMKILEKNNARNFKF